MSLPNLFDNTMPSFWHRLLPGRMKRKESVSSPVKSIIIRGSNSKPDCHTREIYRSLSDVTIDMSPSVISNGSRKSNERKYRTSFTPTPHMNTNYHYKHHRRNFSQNSQLNGCINSTEQESMSTTQQTTVNTNKPLDENTEKKKKRSFFSRLVSRKGKLKTRSEQITCTLKDKDKPASNLTQIKQPHLRSNILTSGASNGLQNANYSGYIGQPRRFMSDMNLYVPKSVKNLSTSAALEGQYIDESFSFLADENIVMVSGSNHQIANGEFVLSQKSYSTGFASEFSLPIDVNYSSQQHGHHFYDNNFESIKMKDSQNSGTSYEESDNDNELSELERLRQQLNIRKATLSKPTLHMKSSFKCHSLMGSISETGDKDVLY